ncbi:MAG: GNAT family N-acetyltransferase [Peptococcaceae bacterium]|nr:GNAT family N-acetyltransferase [Peptococcaceae bacterium]
MLKFVRVRHYSLAELICEGLELHNFVKRQPEVILKSPHYAIYEGEKLAGWIGCARRRGAVFEVRHLTVRPELRGKGVGLAAVEFMMRLLRQHGAVCCYAHIRRDNIASQSLFQKCGFTLMREGLVRKYLKLLREGP